MGLFARLFGKNAPSKPKNDHAVIVHFDFGSTDLSPLFVLEEELADSIAEASVGEFDGNEVALDGSDGSLYMYGPNADRLFEVVRPILERSTAIKNAVATLSYGSAPDAKSVKVQLRQGP